ncbi:hypothetical protein Tco_1120551, partial [Tanacetum coccineum]
LALLVYDIGNEVPLNVHGVGIIGNQRSEIVTSVPLPFSECQISPVGDVSQPACSFPGIFGTTSTSMDNMDVSIVCLPLGVRTMCVGTIDDYCAISIDHMDCIKCRCLGYVGTPGLLVDGVGAHTMVPSGNRIADTGVLGPSMHPNTCTLKPAIKRELMA